MMRIAKKLHRDERGASVIELALTVPLLCFLLLGAVDMGMGYSERLALQQAASRTLEMGMVKGEVNSSYDYLQAVAASVSGQPSGNVVIGKWLQCDYNAPVAFDSTCGSNQQTARYISVQITGTHQPLINYAWLAQYFGGSGPSGSVAITGKAAVRIQ